MAIIIICRQCKGTGYLKKKKFIIFSKPVCCPYCNGTGKLNVSS